MPSSKLINDVIGGGSLGEKKLEQLISHDIPQSIVGYLTEHITNKENEIKVKDFLCQLSSVNSNLSNNVYLLAGDGNLELIAPLLSDRADAKALSKKDEPWVEIHSILKKLTQKEVNAGRECTYFIDTNPSFSIYTQMAILAGEFLLVPINADDSSIYAISGLFNLIWGSDNQHQVYSKYTFASKVDGYKLERPQIALLLGNRFTQKVGAAHAFRALSNQAINKMYEEYQKHSDYFIDMNNIQNLEAFKNQFNVELRDFNSAGVVAANQGLPLSKMDQHSYEVYGDMIQVSKEQREKCREVIVDLVTKL